jgi:hypothetical protein
MNTETRKFQSHERKSSKVPVSKAENLETSNFSNTETRKFQSLELEQEYQVQSYADPFITKFGESMILLVSEEGSDETFELYATKLLLQYIKEKKPKKHFTFTVKEKNCTKYPFIEGYSQERKWNNLK